MVTDYEKNGEEFVEKQKFKAYNLQKVLTTGQKFGFKFKEFLDLLKSLSKHENFKK